MNEGDEILGGLLDDLGFVVFEALEAGGLRNVSKNLPDWFTRVFTDDIAMLAECSDFLNYFLGEAREHWAGESAGELHRSGTWEEGGEHFEALAILKGGVRVLAIERCGVGFDAYSTQVQRSNELSLARAKSNRETQRRVILLDCVVHDLSNPLATVLVNLQYLAKRLPDGVEKKAASMALEQVERQRGMLRSIVGLFSASEGDGRGASGTADASEAVQAAVRAQLGAALDCRVAILAEIGEEKKRVLADESHLLRAVENLVVNAVRHSPSDGTVTLGCVAEGATVTISVEDEGGGVDETVAATLFEPFERDRSRGGQVGLGLFFCKRVVERWGGEIGFENKPSGGAKFWMRLRTAPD